jgi:hypothetical protein
MEVAMGLTKDVWNLSEQDFPGTSPIESQLQFLLRYAILAPSVRNTQPWTFQIEGNAVHLIAAWERELPVADPTRRELHISLGCALENLLVAAEHFGFRHEVVYLPRQEDDRVAATITFSPGGTPTPARSSIALDAILERHNDNSVYRSTPVPEEVCRSLQACQMEPELRLNLTDDHLFHRWIERFTLDADRQEFADPEYREELGYWIGQGVLRGPGLAAKLGGLAVARLDLGESVAEQDYKVVDSAALLGVISAADDTHLTHIKTGQFFERIWLTATAMGANIHPMSQTMRRPEIRASVADLIPEGRTPQQLFRVGYSSRKTRHTPRLPLEEVLSHPPT